MNEPAPVKSLAALGLTAQGGGDAEVSGLSVDSRKTRPGHLFAALPGSKIHGAEFIQYALRMGAVAVLTDPEGARLAFDVLEENPDVALVVTEDPRAALAYAAADCLVVPSVEDNLPNTILESLACGTPIIAFDAGGIPEMIEDGRTGHLVSGGDVAGLAQALQQVIAGGLAGDAVRQRCRTFAESEYAPTRQAQRYLSLFNELTQRDVVRGGR